MRDFGKVYKYKNQFITITKKKDNYYTANYTVNGKEYYSGNSDVDKILKYFRFNVDKLTEKNMKEQTPKEEYWEKYGKVTYKNRVIEITPLRREKDGKIFYIGRYSKRGCKYSLESTIESIHYDKVVSKFKRFVDEYCTDWVVSSSIKHKDYTLVIKRDRKDCSSFFGTCKIHKNSSFKYISNSLKEIEEKFKARIDKMIYEKENNRLKEIKVQRKMLTPKQEKIQELEQLQARISAQLEELKKEKDTLTYKGVVLEYGKEEGLEKDWMIGRIRNAPQGTEDFYGMYVSNIKDRFETYIDDLEKSANIYNQLIGK